MSGRVGVERVVDQPDGTAAAAEAFAKRANWSTRIVPSAERRRGRPARSPRSCRAPARSARPRPEVSAARDRSDLAHPAHELGEGGRELGVQGKYG